MRWTRGEALTSGGAPVATSRAGGKRRAWLVAERRSPSSPWSSAICCLRRDAEPPSRARRDHANHDRRRLEGEVPRSPRTARRWPTRGRARPTTTGTSTSRPLGVGTKALRLTDAPGERPGPRLVPGRTADRLRASCATNGVAPLHGPVARRAGTQADRRSRPVSISSSTSTPSVLVTGRPVARLRREVARRTSPPASCGSRWTRWRSSRSPRRRRAPLGDQSPAFSPDGRLDGLRAFGLDVVGRPGRMGPARGRWRGPAADLREIRLLLGPHLDAGWRRDRLHREPGNDARSSGSSLAGGEPQPVPGVGQDADRPLHPRESDGVRAVGRHGPATISGGVPGRKSPPERANAEKADRLQWE